MTPAPGGGDVVQLRSSGVLARPGQRAGGEARVPVRPARPDDAVPTAWTPSEQVQLKTPRPAAAPPSEPEAATSARKTRPDRGSAPKWSAPGTRRRRPASKAAPADAPQPKEIAAEEEWEASDESWSAPRPQRRVTERTVQAPAKQADTALEQMAEQELLEVLRALTVRSPEARQLLTEVQEQIDEYWRIERLRQIS